jgi:hypothetical protein
MVGKQKALVAAKEAVAVTLGFPYHSLPTHEKTEPAVRARAFMATLMKEAGLSNELVCESLGLLQPCSVSRLQHRVARDSAEYVRAKAVFDEGAYGTKMGPKQRFENARLAVKRVTGVDILNDMETRSRKWLLPRRMVQALLRESGMRVTHIGSFLGKDHSTVIHNLRAHEIFMEGPVPDVDYINQYTQAKRYYGLKDASVIPGHGHWVAPGAKSMESRFDRAAYLCFLDSSEKRATRLGTKIKIARIKGRMPK